MKKTYDFCIIGAGSIGLPLSYYLSKKGVAVVVIDMLASPGRGQNRSAIGGIRATHSDNAKIKICKESIRIISNFKDEHGIEVDWIQGGYLFPVYDEMIERDLKSILDFQKSCGLNIDWVGPKDVGELVPGINSDGLRGGIYSPEDGHASPLKTADAYYLLSCRNGVEFRFREKVTGFDRKGGKIRAVLTDKGDYPVGFVVNCAGAEAREVGGLLGIDLPVYPDSHEGGITEPVKRFFYPMVVDLRKGPTSANYYFYQNAEGQIVFCMTPDPVIPGKDIDCTSQFLPEVSERMLNLLPRLRSIRVRRTWRGLYPMTPDGLPVVGYDVNYDNLFHAVGMCGQGFMIGPGLGKILSEIFIENNLEYSDILDELSPYRNFDAEEKLK